MWDHPRIRGEHRATAFERGNRLGSSPHTRGALFAANRLRVRLGIIPAYAGSTNTNRTRTHDKRDHPRIRGEHIFQKVLNRRDLGSSPHTRGALRGPISRGPHRGIIPAYAGSTDCAEWVGTMTRDHPRIRGEHPHFCDSVRFIWGSSPHTRGALVAPCRPDGGNGIIPAYAGSTDFTGCTDVKIRDHPRIRGEHVYFFPARKHFTGSSPHTRGALVLNGGVGVQRGIIPAYAGSTHHAIPQCQPERDHPRIRGEHCHRRLGLLLGLGSSPHTRGAH